MNIIMDAFYMATSIFKPDNSVRLGDTKYELLFLSGKAQGNETRPIFVQVGKAFFEHFEMKVSTVEDNIHSMISRAETTGLPQIAEINDYVVAVDSGFSASDGKKIV